jgi:hypothetical protein
MTRSENRRELIGFEISQRIERGFPMALPVGRISHVRCSIIDHPPSEDVLIEITEVILKKFSLRGPSGHGCRCLLVVACCEYTKCCLC